MNRLADSLSPYLLQHKDNPVDWYPWGDEAFELARQTNRPIFLSVGYAACHWCHVMEHESFENQSIARFLNEHFVSIKVDREERPDIDQIYMNAVQVMTGRGGWPMSVFLNHDLQPFYAGTYWPPTQKFGMPGFAQVLDALVDAWQNRRDEVERHAGEITGALHSLAIGSHQTATAVPSEGLIDQATESLLGVLDRTDGGFGGAPKFPHATDLGLLLLRGQVNENQSLTEAALFTLDKMAAGGIRDHVGGGFARYSVDEKWLVPHFEKMLYDNALLAEMYLRGFQVSGQSRYAAVAREILDYLCRDMTDQAGGFHCSEDADSEGVEGKYYVWTPGEVIAVLGSPRGEAFCQAYDITEGGNFEGKSIPNTPGPIDENEFGDDRETLRIARQSRIRPGRDDKVLAAWNSLAIKSLAIAGAVLDDADYIDAAIGAAEFIQREMVSGSGRLLHAFRDGQAHLDGYLDDYAYTIEAFIALYEATADSRWISASIRYAETLLQHFADDDLGGFFYTADDAESLITRNKDWHDGSLVSGNASAAMGLIRLADLTDRDDFRAAAQRTLRAGAEILEKQSAACAGLLTALDRFHHGQEQLVIAVADDRQFGEIRSKLLSVWRPRSTVAWVVGQSDDDPLPLTIERTAVDGQPTLYRCENFSCDWPLVGQQVDAWLRESIESAK